jgi:Ca-activated chloride channel family protein
MARKGMNAGHSTPVASAIFSEGCGLQPVHPSQRTVGALAPEGCSFRRLAFSQRLKLQSTSSPYGRAEARPLHFPHHPSRLVPHHPGGLVLVQPGRLAGFCRRIACCALIVLAPFALAAQDTTLHVDVKLVNVFVNVTDKTGAIVGALTRDDFQITEDGRPQRIAVFERQSEMPLSLTLAIDTSGSVFKDRALEQTAARRFVHAMMRPQDRMSLLEFATVVTERTGFTNKVSQIDRGLDQLRGGDATALYDAIYLGCKSLGRLEGRKVMVLVSDGGDTAKNTTYADALEQALRNEVMIYSLIDVPIEASAGRDLGGEHALITLAEQTGGKSFYVNDGGLDKAFARVSDDLRTQYLLGYYPWRQAPGTNFHRVQVTIPRASAQDFNISHRTGYYADSPVKSN